MVNQEKVQEYRNGNNEPFQYLILYHIQTADEIVRQYVSRQFPFEDLQEFAHFTLIEIIIRAREKLVDNNITFYIQRRLRQRLLDHIKSERKSGTRSKAFEKQTFTDVPCVGDLDASVMFQECYEQSIENDLQRQIVEKRMQGYTFEEIARSLKMSLMPVYRNWSRFTTRLENCYAK